MKTLNKIFFLFLLIAFLSLFIFETGVYPNGNSNGYWAPGANVLSARRNGAGAFWPDPVNPTFFFIGGDTVSMFPLQYIDKYNIQSNTWTRLPDMPNPVQYLSACILKDSLYIVGGMLWINYNSACKLTQKYDIKAGSWTQKAPLPFETAWNRIVAYQDSLIYSFGGFINYTSTGCTNVYVYNANTDIWRPATSLSDPNCGMAAAITGDTIVIINGGPDASSTQLLTSRGVINQNDRSQITWTYGTQIPVGPVRVNASSWGCKGIITTPGGTGSSNVSCYVYSNDTWIQQPNAPYPASLPACGSFINGSIGKFILASGTINAYPLRTPYTQIYTDSVCIPIGIKRIGETVPMSYKLYQNYPNPFNPSTFINYQLPVKSFVTIVIYDILGRNIAQLVNKEQTSGSYQVEWDASDYSSGVYFYKLTAGGFQDIKKMLLIK